MTIANQVFRVLQDTFFSATGSQPPVVGRMDADVRARALSGLQPRVQQPSAGREDANAFAVGTTSATFYSVLPDVTPVAAPVAVAPPSQIVLPQILPGGTSNLAEAIPAPSSGTSEILGSSLVNGNFATGDFTGWTLDGAGAVLKQFGTLTPQSLTDCVGNSNCSSFLGLIDTATGVTLPGCGSGNVCTRTTLSQSFNVGSSGILTFKGGGLLMSNEFPLFAGPENSFNDQFIIKLVDSSGKTYTIAQKGVNDLASSFTPSTFSATVGAFTLSLGAGLCQDNCNFLPNNKTVVVTPGTATLQIVVENISDPSEDSAILGAFAAVIQDPPQFFIQNGTFTRADPAPLLQLTNDARTFDSLLIQ